MGTDHDDSRVGGPHAVPVEAIPDPVVGYDCGDDGPEVSKTNDAFDSAFDTVSSGTPVRQWLRESVGASESTVDDVCSSLVSCTAVDIEIEIPARGDPSETTRYRLRTLDPATTYEHVDGYCLLTERGGDLSGSATVEVDRIASVISHDLRNPLDVAKANLQAGRERGDEEYFDNVEQAHDRIEGIIQDVLTLARGQRTLKTTPDVDIGSVAADAWTTVDTNGASITLEDTLPSTEADPDRLQRLFENLFRNSVEHARPTSDDAAGTTSGPDSDTDESLQIRVGGANDGFFVADNGVGIPSEERDRVFDPGYSTSETEGGTGLGLTIVEEITDAHGWTVTLTSGPQNGTRFEFRVAPEE